jgi:hypothetical protein
MPPFVEIGYAVRGLWRLLQFDPSGLDYFDRSIAGFWRSFRVAVLVAPLYALLVPYKLAMVQPTADWQQIILVEILTYIIAWFLFPVVAYDLCRWLSREAEYPGYIVTYNWSALTLATANAVVWLPTFAGTTAVDTSATLSALVNHAFYIYLWFLTRAALKIETLTAVGLIFVEYVLSFLLALIHVAMLKPL